MTDATQALISELTSNLTSLLQIETTLDIHNQQDEESYVVVLDSPDAGILIGHHGKSLEAIQILLGQMVYKRLGKWIRIIVTVGDYREKREKQLKEMAANLVERVLETQTSITVSDLSPAERRIIHLELSQHSQVESVSEGEGRERKLIVKLRA